MPMMMVKVAVSFGMPPTIMVGKVTLAAPKLSYVTFRKTRAAVP
jgi:hypothetical protein